MNSNVVLPSDKKFGFFFSLIFLILYFYLLFFKNLNYYLPLIISLILASVSIFKPNILKKLNYLWFKLGIVLGKFFSPIILGIIFFVIITPISLFMKIVKRDELKLTDKHEKTFWENYKHEKINMKNQY